MDEDVIDEVVDEQPVIELAEITAVTANGVKIKIDGEDSSSDKEYKVNAAQKFVVGDRVKIHAMSGSYVIEYVVGAPMERYPLPKGGSNGSVLMKNGDNDYAVTWGTIRQLPSGGSNGNVLLRTSDGYTWGTINGFNPSNAGSTGNVLTKTAGGYNWASMEGFSPENTGSTGNVLTKTATGYNWASPSSSTVNQLKNGSITVTLNSSGHLIPSGNRGNNLGSSSNAFGDLYARGNVYLGYNQYSTIGFFGAGAKARQTVSTTGSDGGLSSLITALRNYGLIG